MKSFKVWFNGLFFLFLGLLLTLLPAWSQGEASPGQAQAGKMKKYDFSLLYWSPAVSGTTAPVNYLLDLKSDLGLKNTNGWGGKLSCHFTPRRHLSLSAISVKGSGSSVLGKPVVYQGNQFSAGSALNSDFLAQLTELRYAIQAGNLDERKNFFNWLVGIRADRYGFRVARGSCTSDQNFCVMYPELGFNFQQSLGSQIFFTGDLAASSLSFSHNTLNTLDYTLGLQWESGKSWSLGLGYRNLWFGHGDSLGNTLGVRLQGPMFNLKYEF